MSATSGIRIDDLRPADREAAHLLGRQSFNATNPYDPERPPMAEGRHVAAYEGDRLVGQVRRHPFGQWFGGRRLPCAGISGVNVAPEARHRALARRMVAESLERAVADGELVATLFPTTAALYRSAGFEVAGWWVERSVPVAELPRPDGSVAWEPASFDDPRHPALHDRMAAGRDGWVTPDADLWRWRARHAAGDTGTNRYLYVGLRHGEPVASLQYAYSSSERAMYRIDVEALHAVDGAAVREALAFLGGHGTTADEVRTTLPAADLELHLDHVHRTRPVGDWPWMLALLDVPGAIAARGYPTGVTGVVPLEITDAHRPANAGRWVLTVADGRATLERGGDGRAAVTVTDLAAVFTGHLDPRRLADAGRLGGATTGDTDLLRTAFAGDPTLTIFF